VSSLNFVDMIHRVLFCGTNVAALLFRYYSGDDPEDAWDMRKALARDEKKQSVIPMDRPVLPQELEW